MASFKNHFPVDARFRLCKDLKNCKVLFRGVLNRHATLFIIVI